MNEEIEIGTAWMGEDAIIRVEYEVVSFGAAGTRWLHSNDPDREDPEYWIGRIFLRLDLPAERDASGRLYHPTAPEFEATGALLRGLANDPDIKDAVYDDLCERAAEHFEERRYRRRAF